MSDVDPRTTNADQEIKVTIANDDRVQRWQATQMQQLSYAINLILLLAGAVLGFEVSLLLNQTFDPGNCVVRVSLCFSLISLVLSIFCGLVAVVTRLYDFRFTTRVAREDSKPEHQKDGEKLCRYRCINKALGRISWYLFWAQIVFFGVGMLCAIPCVAALAYQKLG